MKTDDYIEAGCVRCHALLASQDYDDLLDYLDTHHCPSKHTPASFVWSSGGRLF